MEKHRKKRNIVERASNTILESKGDSAKYIIKGVPCASLSYVLFLIGMLEIV